MYPKTRKRLVVKACMGEVASARWLLLACTASFQRLAAYLPGLVCPYRQAGLCRVASTVAKESRPHHLLLPPSLYPAVGYP